MRWEATIGDWTYHAGSFGDLSGDGVPDVALGDYSAILWALDGATGEVLWSSNLQGETYIFGPTAMGDLDGDGALEVVVTGSQAHVFDAAGAPVRSWDLPGYCPRGPVLVDLDGDALPDVLTAVSGPVMAGWSGLDGSALFSEHLAGPADMDFHPVVWDLDGDLENEVFAVYGRGWSDPDPEANWGRAVALHLGVVGKGWPTFSHDHHHSGNFEYPVGHLVNEPDTSEEEQRCGCRTAGGGGAWLFALAALGWRRKKGPPDDEPDRSSS
ncbi:MAG: VCBS repeat-containing protein [Deltaproteobacteria bacterium]|nr:VCBS repeat-containing protein [Deltaproteobacteria bacterium]